MSEIFHLFADYVVDPDDMQQAPVFRQYVSSVS